LRPAMPRTSAISGPVNRSLLSAAIASTRCSLVRCGIPRGADERSCSPNSLDAVAAHPFARAADTDSGGRGCLRQRPCHNPTTEQATAFGEPVAPRPRTAGGASTGLRLYVPRENLNGREPRVREQ
jgi:hypothetical protein